MTTGLAGSGRGVVTAARTPSRRRELSHWMRAPGSTQPEVTIRMRDPGPAGRVRLRTDGTRKTPSGGERAGLVNGGDSSLPNVDPGVPLPVGPALLVGCPEVGALLVAPVVVGLGPRLTTPVGLGTGLALPGSWRRRTNLQPSVGRAARRASSSATYRRTR